MANSIETPPNSIWPNGLKLDSEGYVTFYTLGTNKVDISTITWPDGDKLISPFVYQNDELVGFVDTKALTVSGTATTTMNYSHIEADFASISEGALTVDAPNATVKKFKWAVSTGGDGSFDFVIIDVNTANAATINTVRTARRVVDNNLYDENDGLIGTIDTSKIEVGDGLFFNCPNLTLFSSDLSNLTNGSTMFRYCTAITSFTLDLSSLTDGSWMFDYCTALTSFSSDLSSLTNGSGMFQGCPLTTFTSDLSNLTDGYGMFNECTNLTTFSSDLSNLADGYIMFENCKLDAPSVKNIIDTINTSYSGYLSLGIGCDEKEEDVILFTQEVGYANIPSLLVAFEAKGWTVEIQANGRPTTTYGLRRPSGNTLPIFAKLEETEKYADYTSMDGSKKYRLRWFHMTNGSTEGYTQFNSLEEAIAHFNIKPIERN